MAEEITITIRKDDLGPAKPEFGIKDDLKLFDGKENRRRVKVFVDGKLADRRRRQRNRSLSRRRLACQGVARPQEDMLTIVVTTKDDKITQRISMSMIRKKRNLGSPLASPETTSRPQSSLTSGRP